MKKFIISILLIHSFTHSFIHSSSAQGLCCDVPGWQYAVEIDIDNTCCATTFNNYQVLIIIDTQTPISLGNMKTDGSDIRFLDYLCGSFLDYWIESSINTTTTQIWVTVPFIAPNAITTIYMVYGNPAATPVSNFNVVFPNVLIINTTVTLGGNQNYDWIDIQVAGNVIIPAGQILTFTARKVIMAGNINGNGTGYGPQAGPGAGVNGGGGVGGSGGSYGGIGGSGGGGTSSTYGTANGSDIDMGSGGGGSDCPPSASGGGAIAIYASVVELTGTIYVNGSNASNCCCGNSSEAAGGGSGGGILIEGDYVSGSGSLYAQGGNGGNSDTKEGGGGGAGGRIKIFYCINNSFGGTTNVSGGAPGVGPQTGEQPGQAGTSTVNTIVCELVSIGPERPIRLVPTAAFNANDVCLYDSAVFNDSSTITGGSIVAWSWDFGDGNASSAQDTTNLYLSDGSYNVTLIVTSDSGCVDSITLPLTIYPVPASGFTTNSVCAYDSALFFDISAINSGTITGWNWDFGDGNASTVQNPANLYSINGTYNVSLLVTSNNGCTDSIIQPIQIHTVPQAGFSAANVCLYDAAVFTDTSIINAGNITSWDWDFGDLAPGETVQNPVHLYGTDSIYNVSLIVTSDSGCVDTVVRQIEIYPIPLADFSIIDDCLNDSAVFNDLSTVSSGSISGWDWDFGDGPPAGGSTVQNPVFLYDSAGIYSVTLIVSSGFGCLDTITKNTERYAIPQVDFSPTLVCLDDTTWFTDLSTVVNDSIVSWLWDFGDSTALSNVQNPGHLFSLGQYNVILIVQSSNGCLSFANKLIGVYPLPIAGFTNMLVCTDELTFFTDTSSVNGAVITNWMWDFGDGSPLDTATNPTHIYTVEGTYNVQLVVTTNNTCTDTLVDTIVVYPLPVAGFTNDTVCPTFNTGFTDLSTLSSGSIVSWEWDFGDGGTSLLQDPAHPYAAEGPYNVRLIVTTIEGCIDDTVRQVEVYPEPVAGFSFLPAEPDKATLLNPFITFTNTSSGAIVADTVFYQWYFGDGDSAFVQSPDFNAGSTITHTYSDEDTGTYTVQLIVENSFSCRDSITYDVMIKGDYTLFAPSAFSPNGDGKNEYFLPIGIGFDDKEFELYIYDRWGDLIYETDNIDKPWDGKANDGSKIVPQGVYIWLIKTKDINSKRHQYVGHVTLIR